MKNIVIEPIKSRIITNKDTLFEVLLKSLKKRGLKNGEVVIISSKVVAVTQNRIAKISTAASFHNLVKSEADEVIGEKEVTLTLKNGIFIPWAGIDRSNTPENSAILWPNQPFEVAFEIMQKLKKHYQLKQIGVIITDSWCLPLRQGVSGIALSYAGFKGVTDLRGRKDLFGNKLKITQQATADNLATAAHLAMGEGAEATPFIIITNAPVKFTAHRPNPESLQIKPANCLYAPLYRPLQ